MNRFQHDNLGQMTAKRRAMGFYNGKPYRTAALKAAAKKDATKRADGAWRSSVKRLHHPMPRAS